MHHRSWPLGLLLLLGAAGAAPPAPIDPNAPRHVHIVPTEQSDQILFSWTTGTPDWAHKFGVSVVAPPVDPIVKVGTVSGVYTLTWTGNYSVQYNQTGDIIHRVYSAPLAPDTRYFYTVGDAVIGVFGAEFSFNSAPVVSASTPTNLLICADMGNDRSTAGLVQRDLALRVAANSSTTWHGLLFPGDLSYAGSNAPGNISQQTKMWDAWMTDLEPVIANVPVHTSVGNHDVNVSTGDTSGGECGVAVNHRFHMPFQNESSTDFSCAASYNVRYWYSVIVGSVWVHTFSTAHSYFEGSEQRTWIESDLAAAAVAKSSGLVSWVVVQMHYPAYCSHPLGDCNNVNPAKDPAAWLRANLEHLWKVGAVLWFYSCLFVLGANHIFRLQWYVLAFSVIIILRTLRTTITIVIAGR